MAWPSAGWRSPHALSRRSDLAAAAAQSVDFVRERLWRDGRLSAVCTADRVRFPAYLDDYAFLLDGLIELLQTQWRTPDLTLALELAEALLTHFEDRQDGGFLLHRGRSRDAHASFEVIRR